MKLAAAIRQAVACHDAVLAGQIAEQLRFRMGLNYQESYALVNRLAPITLVEWDALLEADSAP